MVVKCPKCGSLRIRIVWAAMDSGDTNSYRCPDCDHTWTH